MTAILLHAIVPSAPPDALLGEGNFSVSFGAWCAIVSTAPQDLADPTRASEAAMAHHALVLALHRAGLALPIRFGTAFSSAQALLEAFQPHRPEIASWFAAHAGCDEVTVTITAVATGAAPVVAATGREWLRTKGAARDQGAARNIKQKQAVATLVADVMPLVLQSREGGKQGVLADIRLLVHREKMALLHQALAERAEWFDAQGLDVTLSGPWPLYSFARFEELANARETC